MPWPECNGNIPENGKLIYFFLFFHSGQLSHKNVMFYLTPKRIILTLDSLIFMY